MDTRPRSVVEIAEAIRRYLEANPQAFDTARGIREWWLRDAKPLFAEDVEQAIELLVGEGALVPLTLPEAQRGNPHGATDGFDATFPPPDPP